MISIIRTWGNSQGIYIPKNVLRELGLKVGDQVELTVEDGALVLKKDDGMLKKQTAAENIRAVRKTAPTDFDYRAELNDYLDERYGEI